MSMRDRARAAAEAERAARRKAKVPLKRDAAAEARAERQRLRRDLKAKQRRWTPSTKKSIEAWAKKLGVTISGEPTMKYVHSNYPKVRWGGSSSAIPHAMIGTFTCEGVEFTYHKGLYDRDESRGLRVWISDDPERADITSLAVLGERLEALETRGTTG